MDNSNKNLQIQNSQAQKNLRINIQRAKSPKYSKLTKSPYKKKKQKALNKSNVSDSSNSSTCSSSSCSSSESFRIPTKLEQKLNNIDLIRKFADKKYQSSYLHLRNLPKNKIKQLQNMDALQIHKLKCEESEKLLRKTLDLYYYINRNSILSEQELKIIAEKHKEQEKNRLKFPLVQQILQKYKVEKSLNYFEKKPKKKSIYGQLNNNDLSSSILEQNESVLKVNSCQTVDIERHLLEDEREKEPEEPDGTYMIQKKLNQIDQNASKEQYCLNDIQKFNEIYMEKLKQKQKEQLQARILKIQQSPVVSPEKPKFKGSENQNVFQQRGSVMKQKLKAQLSPKQLNLQEKFKFPSQYQKSDPNLIHIQENDNNIRNNQGIIFEHIQKQIKFNQQLQSGKRNKSNEPLKQQYKQQQQLKQQEQEQEKYTGKHRTLSHSVVFPKSIQKQDSFQKNLLTEFSIPENQSLIFSQKRVKSNPRERFLSKVQSKQNNNNKFPQIRQNSLQNSKQQMQLQGTPNKLKNNSVDYFSSYNKESSSRSMCEIYGENMKSSKKIYQNNNHNSNNKNSNSNNSNVSQFDSKMFSELSPIRSLQNIPESPSKRFKQTDNTLKKKIIQTAFKQNKILQNYNQSPSQKRNYQAY